jgi:hypothetical protein
MSASSPRVRARLSRTFARARWEEYRRLLTGARAKGYEPIALHEWVASGRPDGRLLILRHDVDQHPRSALRLAAIERALGVSSTWYFRWRTAHPAVIGALREQGFGVGLHYETLSRLALGAGVAEESAAAELMARARVTLRSEVRAFEHAHGPIGSICPHGDSRVPAIRNARLLDREDPSAYGIEFDGNEVMRGQALEHWLTDRSAPEGGWHRGVEPDALFETGSRPILCLVHPNNWTSGGSLWVDRIAARTLPSELSRPVRTGRDQPPL